MFERQARKRNEMVVTTNAHREVVIVAIEVVRYCLYVYVDRLTLLFEYRANTCFFMHLHLPGPEVAV